MRLLNENEAEIRVPFLVTKEDIEEPIIGLNVIELIVKNTEDEVDSKRKGLTAKQREQAKQLLLEDADAFAMNDDDVDCISELEMDAKMTTDLPVQKNYLSIPCPLYPEVKGYIEDLLKQGFIRKSTSPFSSSVVCVHKRDGGMILCIDYRELNKKTVPDRHPIPHIQEALDSLGGKSWFRVLDQGKAYHQGFMGR